MENNVTLITFPEESQAYQAYSQLKSDPLNDSCTITQLVLMKKEDGKLVCKESYDTGLVTQDDTWRGGLIGGLVGILGGPIGMLLGMSMGMLVGSSVDIGDAVQNVSMLEQTAKQIADGGTALLALTKENDPAMLDARVKPFNATVRRFDAASVQEEVEEANRLQAEMQKEVRANLRKEKSEARKARIAQIKEKFKEKL